MSLAYIAGYAVGLLVIGVVVYWIIRGFKRKRRVKAAEELRRRKDEELAAWTRDVTAKAAAG